MVINKDYYSILGISRNATKDEIKKAFKLKAIELHPDVNKSPTANCDFKNAREAYEYLVDDNQRRQYDRLHNYQEYNNSQNKDTKKNTDDSKSQNKNEYKHTHNYQYKNDKENENKSQENSRAFYKQEVKSKKSLNPIILIAILGIILLIILYKLYPGLFFMALLYYAEHLLGKLKKVLSCKYN